MILVCHAPCHAVLRSWFAIWFANIAGGQCPLSEQYAYCPQIPMPAFGLFFLKCFSPPLSWKFNAGLLEWISPADFLGRYNTLSVMSLSELTDPNAVLAALKEYDRLGQAAFLEKYGYAPARRYQPQRDGKTYDSKAIVGPEFGYQFP